MGQSIENILLAFYQRQRSRSDTLRALLSYSQWRLQIFDQDEPEIVPDDKGTPFVIVESTVETGQVIDGRSLIRDIVPPDTGIVFDIEEPWALLFHPEQMAELRQWTQVVDLEEAVLCPAPGQVRTLLDGPWWGVVVPGQSQLVAYRDNHRDGALNYSFDGVTLFTAPDAVETFRVTDRHRKLDIIPLEPNFWQDLATRSDYDGIRINPCTPRYAFLPPHLPAGLVAGHDVRIGVEPLQVHDLAEIDLWLDITGARHDKRSLTPDPTAANTWICAAWWGHDPQQIPVVLTAPTTSAATTDAPSQILCAGLLLRFAQGKLAGLPRFRWQTSADHRRRATQALRALSELRKLVKGDGVPFAALRTPKGAQLWHQQPEAFTRTAVETLYQRAKRLAG